MICKITCAIALVFIIGNLFFMSNIPKINTKFIKPYVDLLNTDLKEKYHKIVAERSQLNLQGYGLGVAISAVVIATNYFIQSRRPGPKTPLVAMMCLAAAITFLTHYFYYILMPKSDYMVLHLHQPHQREAWLNVYKKMQWNYHSGIAIGIVGVVLLAGAFRC
jgi:hypothetical protein